MRSIAYDKIIRILIPSVFTLALSACGATTPSDDGGGGCSDDKDCSSGQVCDDGTCKTLCSSDEHCDPDQHCNRAAGVCEAGSNVECTIDDDCDDFDPECEFAESASCVNDACVYVAKSAETPCDDGNDCTINDRCNGSGTCIGTVDPLCVEPNDCNGPGDCDLGEECIDNKCLLQDGGVCASNVDCINVCVNKTCQAASSTGGPCDDDGDCADGNICPVDTCLKGNGADCTLGTDCATGHCADNFCCDVACDEPCDSCAENPGTCTGANSGSCDDGVACTYDDTCFGGTCAGTTYSCDDQNLCTDDFCQGDNTCQYDDRDGEACGACNTCVGSTCTGITALDGPDCEDDCTHCEAGSCIPYAEGSAGECAMGYACCGDPLTCEGSSASCPGGTGMLFGIEKTRFAELYRPGASLFVY